MIVDRKRETERKKERERERERERGGRKEMQQKGSSKLQGESIACAILVKCVIQRNTSDDIIVDERHWSCSVNKETVL